MVQGLLVVYITIINNVIDTTYRWKAITQLNVLLAFKVSANISDFSVRVRFQCLGH